MSKPLAVTASPDELRPVDLATTSLEDLRTAEKGAIYLLGRARAGKADSALTGAGSATREQFVAAAERTLQAVRGEIRRRTAN